MVELKYTAIEFYHSSPIEIDSALEYLEQKKKIDTLTNTRPIAEAIRLNAVITFNSNVDKKSQIKDAKKLIMFPWELEYIKNKEPEPMESMLAKMELMAATFGKKEK